MVKELKWMFSGKHINTSFFGPINQFSEVCLWALKTVPGINKAYKNFFYRHTSYVCSLAKESELHSLVVGFAFFRHTSAKSMRALLCSRYSIGSRLRIAKASLALLSTWRRFSLITRSPNAMHFS